MQRQVEPGCGPRVGIWRLLEILDRHGIRPSILLNALCLFTMNGFTGPEFLQTVTDQFDQLYADAATSGRVMALALHPFVTGQPFRARYLDVWLTTTNDIADHYTATT